MTFLYVWCNFPEWPISIFRLLGPIWSPRGPSISTFIISLDSQKISLSRVWVAKWHRPRKGVISERPRRGVLIVKLNSGFCTDRDGSHDGIAGYPWLLLVFPWSWLEGWDGDEIMEVAALRLPKPRSSRDIVGGVWDFLIIYAGWRNYRFRCFVF